MDVATAETRIELKTLGTSAPDRASVRPGHRFLASIPREFARRHLIMSAGSRGGTERLLVSRRCDPAAIFNVATALGTAVETEHADDEFLAQVIDEAYAHGASVAENGAQRVDDSPIVEVEGSDDVEADLKALLSAVETDLLRTDGKGPVVRLVDLILFSAITSRASDVHIQPLADRTLVRYRLDGVLHTVRELPAGLARAVVSRVKVMARMDVAEQRAPQDGRAGVTVGGSAGSTAASLFRRVDLRISTMPTTYGERVVIRILDNTHSIHLLSFEALGMPEGLRADYLREVSRTSGIVLSTGPTGSGKTTTLYTTLKWISQQRSGGAATLDLKRADAARRSAPESNILTIEDPVEYDLSTAGMAVSQTPVDAKKNVTFATGLRHILRQDPDVIMVGEIRDEETARIAVQASLTGHLVLSTLHTNDAASAVARLIDLKVEPFLVSSSLVAVLAQRLVRTVHSSCGGQGCPACFHTGFRGRTGVFELLRLDEEVRTEVNRNVPAAVIRSVAVRKGMVTLQRAAQLLVAQGRTTNVEVSRVIHGSGDEL